MVFVDIVVQAMRVSNGVKQLVIDWQCLRQYRAQVNRTIV